MFFSLRKGLNVTEKSFGKIGFVGAGNMAEAIIKGLIGNGVHAAKLSFFEPNNDRAKVVKELYGLLSAADNKALIETCDVIVLAVKPQALDSVLDDVAPCFTEDKLLISILAGVTTQRLENAFGGKARVVRVMPNTPALVGQGATALCAGRCATEEDVHVARQIFESVGITSWVDEVQMDAVTGLSGSGPAFVYMFIEAMIAAGVEEGLTPEVARDLTLKTVVGAAQMIRETGETPKLLREKVCSPGGTTIQGVEVLDKAGLRTIVMSAVKAATRRSRELGGNN